ncbi:MAG TPA: winged helix-turn-helix domain-containing protein [Ktedonobacterales bacterium]|nr:winged helix-turn-helix domain-containing protein [Ktedonobacterales bacterium]
MRIPNPFNGLIGWGHPRPTEEQAQQARIDAKLRAIERQGAHSVSFAHGLAYLLVVAFSAGSLITLAGDAINHFLFQARHGVVDIPSLVSFIVSFALVFAMDTAMVIAAATVRMYRQRRQSGALTHILMIAGVCAVESATYLYMSYVYDHPVGWVAWTILTARAVAAPIVAVYLSLAATLPISARDINTQVEVVTGRGVLMDMTKIANDPDATTERKVALYRASAIMDREDAGRLEAIIAAERATRDGAAPAAYTFTPAPSLSASRRLTPTQMGLAAEKTVQLAPPSMPLTPAAFQQSATQPQLHALSRREQRRLALEADMYGQQGVRGHPTSPRESVAYDDVDEFDLSDLGDDWQDEDERMLRNGHLPEMSQRSAKRDRAQAAHMAPTEATLVVKEFVMPELPPSKYERDGDSPQARAVFRVLEDDPRASRREVIERTGVSDGTARRYMATWNERRGKRGRKKIAPRTTEMAAVTPEMLATSTR